MDISTLTPFSTAARYAESFEGWLGEYDQQRIAAYQVWYDLYWSQVNLVTASASGDDPIQVPVARSLIEAIVRYLAVDWSLYIDPRFGTAEERAQIDRVLDDLFKREQVFSKFRSQLRWGLVKGDALWHITADDAKPAGSRISMHTLDPDTYFPIFDEENDDRVIGVHIAYPTEYNKKPAIRRLTYRRNVDDAGTITVTSETGYYDFDSWDDREGELKKPAIAVTAPEEVIEGITQIPVYRVPTTDNPGDPFGSSVLRGLERILRGIDQTVTDEDLAVALGGLGFFATDAPAPTTDDGEEVPWDVAPLNVVQLGTNSKGDPGTFKRIDGVGSIEPSISHTAGLKGAAMEGASVPSVALGSVDAATAESGIALFLRLSPLLAANSEREDVMLGVYDQLLYDLVHDWLPTFEDVNLPDVVVTSSVGDPMPTNREAKIAEIQALAGATPPLITIEEARIELAKLGYQFVSTSGDTVLAQLNRQAAAVDPFAGRLSAEAQETPVTLTAPPAASPTPSAASAVPAA
jgi:hypothetical protein